MSIYIYNIPQLPRLSIIREGALYKPRYNGGGISQGEHSVFAAKQKLSRFSRQVLIDKQANLLDELRQVSAVIKSMAGERDWIDQYETKI